MKRIIPIAILLSSLRRAQPPGGTTLPAKARLAWLRTKRSSCSTAMSTSARSRSAFASTAGSSKLLSTKATSSKRGTVLARLDAAAL